MSQNNFQGGYNRGGGGGRGGYGGGGGYNRGGDENHFGMRRDRRDSDRERGGHGGGRHGGGGHRQHEEFKEPTAGRFNNDVARLSLKAILSFQKRQQLVPG